MASDTLPTRFAADAAPTCFAAFRRAAARIAVGLLLGLVLLVPPSTAGEGDASSFDEEPLFGAIRQAIIAELKDKYQDDKHWGHTTKALSSVRLRGRGTNLHWETHTKQVNDGTWKRYVVTVVEPERQMHVKLDNLRKTDDGRLGFTLRLVAKLHGEAQIEQWERGVKLFGTSAAGDATLAATIACDVGIRFEAGKLAHDVLLDPHVAAIDLELVDLDMQRISRIEGKVAHELGDSFTPMVARQLKRREAKLVEKANASIAKHRDRLRLPIDEFLTSGWSKIPGVSPAAAATGSKQPKSDRQ